MCVCFAQFKCFAQTHQQIFPINLPFFRITSNYSLCTKVQIILFAFGNSDRSDQQQLCKLFQANKYYSKFDKCSFVALFAASRISRLWQLFSCLSQDSQLFANSTWDPNSQIWNTKFPVFRLNWCEGLQDWIFCCKLPPCVCVHQCRFSVILAADPAAGEYSRHKIFWNNILLQTRIHHGDKFV